VWNSGYAGGDGLTISFTNTTGQSIDTGRGNTSQVAPGQKIQLASAGSGSVANPRTVQPIQTTELGYGSGSTAVIVTLDGLAESTNTGAYESTSPAECTAQVQVVAG
jgi:hypothetical protein